MAPADRWNARSVHEPYVPAEFAVDGFVHCTEGEELMAHVANALYRQTPGDFVLLVIDVDKLTAPVRWERPSGADAAPLFPHIYGPINPEAIIEVRRIERDANGAFLL
ncbi:MAG: DUF952 domain-containing protein [Roseiflexus sp.]|nr:DUF952 domain-containing protein [Roseiflexus sp.]MCS7290928.1 DUF952 domain-containing protein [Roseiflexus sp.]MDW8145334.1 DUF952 domain-containing protein [Roseiflexaceae bacterium]MDW8234329.1 DUF952 domain-containing protein [Roseiflexaceae bacterium]